MVFGELMMKIIKRGNVSFSEILTVFCYRTLIFFNFCTVIEIKRNYKALNDNFCNFG